ncbi:Phosphate-binding protein PstS 1 precursor [Vibrio aerogenes CECT 7868]|uniref:Phosphate-binding protein PstS 1 n=1 Tax=Vibrio aerogenes CECT 7868 TaxID=1216006 RepID=A0A1M5ZUJ1_9VIBR|nr:phosphate ABC transporter substrate-binding protein [Vibrio aerogenes]SHI27947.1 Phosphate-binding protein PstS 1 precursor [Vibrio aerogenes CECT 7868]
MLRLLFNLLLSTLMIITAVTSQATAKEITVSGSTSVARIMDVLAEDYNATHPDTYIAVQGIGSTAGITLIKKGVADVAMSSRYMTEIELDSQLDVQLLAYDGLAIVVNLANPVKNLTREQIYKIYKGKITNWKEVGGNDQKIAVVTREAASGSRFSFESLLGLTRVVNNRLVSDISPNNLVVNSNSMVKSLVTHNAQAVGFISTGSVDRSVKALTFEGIKATPDNISNGKYQLSRPFLILHYPGKVSKETNQFTEYLKSDHVRNLVLEYGYIPSIKKM